jgi:SAM-dependent methyltransferase
MSEPPEGFFGRVDETPDELFYREPRFVAHIDPETIEALTHYYSDALAPGADVLDLMSSWISHLPTELELGRVSGLGMNEQELEANPQLSDWWVQNLNETPELPEEHAYDAAVCAVSIQYLTRPVEVMRSLRGALRPGGTVHIAMSHRCFPTKAIAAFQQMGPRDRIQLVGYYLDQGGFEDIEFHDRSPANADPLWIVSAKNL